MILLSKVPVLTPNKPVNPRLQLQLAESQPIGAFQTRIWTNANGEKFSSHTAANGLMLRKKGDFFMSIRRENGTAVRYALFEGDSNVGHLNITRISSVDCLGYNMPKQEEQGREFLRVVLAEALIIAAMAEYEQIMLRPIRQITLIRHYCNYGFDAVESERLELALPVRPTLAPFI